jgi:hypothetical protein
MSLRWPLKVAGLIILSMPWGSADAGPVSLVQSASASCGPGASTCAASLSSPVQQGALLIAALHANNEASASMADSLGQSWTQLATQQRSDGSGMVGLYALPDAGAGAYQVTASFPLPSTSAKLHLYEYAGLPDAITDCVKFGDTIASYVEVGPCQATGAPELLFSAVDPAWGSWDAGAGFTALTPDPDGEEAMVALAPGSYDAFFYGDSTGDVAVIIAGFRSPSIAAPDGGTAPDGGIGPDGGAADAAGAADEPVHYRVGCNCSSGSVALAPLLAFWGLSLFRCRATGRGAKSAETSKSYAQFP